MEFMWGGGSRGRDAMREGGHEGRGEGVCTRISETEYPSYSNSTPCARRRGFF